MEISTKQDALTRIGSVLRPRYKVYADERKTLEQQWLKNLRQYRGVYDSDVIIPEGRSKVYPKETHTKVVGFVAKMMEMMFPASDKNWQITPSPIPSIPSGALSQLIANLTQQRMQAAVEADKAAAAQGQTTQTPPVPLTPKDIEAAIKDLAQERAKNLEVLIEDMLTELGGDTIDFPQLSKKVLRSGGIYGFGLLKGPMVRYRVERTFELDATTNQYAPVEKEVPRPYYEWVKVWDIFPDLSARGWRKQDGIYERMVLTKHALLLLEERKDFEADAIRQFVKEHPTGNYTVSSFDTELNNLNHQNTVIGRDRNKYEVIRWIGYLNGFELYQAGVEGIKESDYDKDMLADIWFLDDVVIKVDRSPFGDNPADHYHPFIFDEDEDSGLTGSGLPETLRDSQLRLCSIDRATQDNMAASAGPIYEVNKDLLPPGYNVGVIHAFKTILREGTGPEAGYPALRQLATESHIAELISLRKEVLETFDRESSLPGWLFGQTQQLGEAFRTSNNMSQMTGGANMVTKDIVRAFDLFTQSVIGSMVKWVQEFWPDEKVKGDFNAIGRGNISLVAKEVRGAALDQFWATLTPEERVRFKDYEVLMERVRSRDLSIDLLEDKDTGDQKAEEYLAGQRAMQEAEAGLTTAKTTKLTSDATKADTETQIKLQKAQAEVAEILSRVDQNIANAKDTQARGEMERIKLLLESLQADLTNQMKASETAAKILTLGGKNESGTRSGTAQAAA